MNASISKVKSNKSSNKSTKISSQNYIDFNYPKYTFGNEKNKNMNDIITVNNNFIKILKGYTDGDNKNETLLEFIKDLDKITKTKSNISK